MRARPVYVVTSDGALRRALLARLTPSTDTISAIGEFPADFGECEVVVAPAADCPSERCAELTAAGVRVLILTPVLRPAEGERYRQAGASAYLPMNVDATDLLRELEAATAAPC